MVSVWFRTIDGAVAHAQVPAVCTGGDLRRVLGELIGEPLPCGLRLFTGGARVAESDTVRPQPDQAFLAVLSVPCILADVLGRDAQHLTGIPYIAAAAHQHCEADLRAACERARSAGRDHAPARAAADVLLEALSNPAPAPPEPAADPDPEAEPEPEPEHESEPEPEHEPEFTLEAEPEAEREGGDKEAGSHAESGNESEGASDSEAALQHTRSLLEALSQLVRSGNRARRAEEEDEEEEQQQQDEDEDSNRGGNGEDEEMEEEEEHAEGAPRGVRRGADGLPRPPVDDRDAFLEYMLHAAIPYERSPRNSSGASGSDSRPSPFRRAGALSTHAQLVTRVHRLARAARAHGVRFADPRAARAAVPDDLVAQLVAVMGSESERRVRRALRLARMNADVALNMLLDGDPRLVDGSDDDDDDGEGDGRAAAFDPETSDADADVLLMHSQAVRHVAMAPLFDEALALVEAGEAPQRSNPMLHDTVRQIRALLGIQ